MQTNVAWMVRCLNIAEDSLTLLYSLAVGLAPPRGGEAGSWYSEVSLVADQSCAVITGVAKTLGRARRSDDLVRSKDAVAASVAMKLSICEVDTYIAEGLLRLLVIEDE